MVFQLSWENQALPKYRAHIQCVYIPYKQPLTLSYRQTEAQTDDSFKVTPLASTR